jgi:sodium/proline symporter
MNLSPGAGMSHLPIPTLIAFVCYIAVVLAIGFIAYMRTNTASDYFLGGRKLSPAVSAISASASDMSAWVLLGLPGYAYLAGLEAVWIVLGLVLGVAANWLLMAKRLRVYSHLLDDAVTIPSYLQRRFAGSNNGLSVIAAISILFFFLFYVASGLIAGGKLFSQVFSIDYHWAVMISGVLILLYTLFGGFLAVSWTDVFQALLMLLAIVVVPIIVFTEMEIGLSEKISLNNPQLLNPFTDKQGSQLGLVMIVSSMGWGLGYFGQPHVLARFKALKHVTDANSAAVIGISWSLVCYSLAVLLGLCGIAYLSDPLVDSEKVFMVLVTIIFHPLIAGILLAAILAAIMSTVDSQLLASSSSLAEDIVPLVTKKQPDAKFRLTVARLSVVTLSLLAILIALEPDNTVLGVVGYAWAGLGASLGPVVLVSLYWRAMTELSALVGVIVGTGTVIIWPHLNGGLFELYALVPGFILSLVAILSCGMLSNEGPKQKVVVQFDKMLKRL